MEPSVIRHALLMSQSAQSALATAYLFHESNPQSTLAISHMSNLPMIDTSDLLFAEIGPSRNVLSPDDWTTLAAIARSLLAMAL